MIIGVITNTEMSKGPASVGKCRTSTDASAALHWLDASGPRV